MNFKDDPSTAIKAVLWASRGSWLTFRQASLLKPNVPATPLDGDVIIPRSNILFLQVLP